MNAKKNPEVFYEKLIDILIEKNIHFMIGGTYAFTEYTGIHRPTKDIDIMATVEDYPTILKTFDDVGYLTELHAKEWIAKVRDEYGNFADVIYAEGNGLYRIDNSWIERATMGTILGHMVKLVPVEELVRSKIYIQYRERFDGADVVHLMLKHGKTLNWNVLMEKMDVHWELLLEHVILFNFIYPLRRDMIPSHVMQTLLKRAVEEYGKPPVLKDVTRGLLISSQFEVDVAKWGFQPIYKLK